MGAQRSQRRASQRVRYLGCGEERHGKLQQALDLDLHGGQGPLEDGQRLQAGQWRAVSVFLVFNFRVAQSKQCGPQRV